jgi:hypothetical protein
MKSLWDFLRRRFWSATIPLMSAKWSGLHRRPFCGNTQYGWQRMENQFEQILGMVGVRPNLFPFEPFPVSGYDARDV